MEVTNDFGIVDNSTDSFLDMFDGGADDITPATDEPKSVTPAVEAPVVGSADAGEVAIVEDGTGVSEDDDPIASIFGETVDEGGANEEPDDTEEAQETEEADSDSTFVSISQELVSLGVFSEDEDDPLPTTGEEFAKRFEKESIRKANENLQNFLSRFGQDRLDAFRAIFVNGVDPKEYFSIASAPEDIFTLDMEQESNQKKVVKKYYQEVLGLSEGRADKLIQSLIEDGELDSEAVTALGKFRETHEQRLAELERQRVEAEQQKLQNKQMFINQVNDVISKKIQEKEIDGFKFDKSVADRVMATLTQDSWRLPNGELITDFQKFMMELSRPENIDIAIKIALLKEHNFDFSKLQLKKANLEKNKLFSNLAQKNKTINRKSVAKSQFDDFTI